MKMCVKGRTESSKTKRLNRFAALLLFVACGVGIYISGATSVYAIERIDQSLSASAPLNLSGTYLVSSGAVSTLTLKLDETEKLTGSSFFGVIQRYSGTLTMVVQPLGACERLTQFGGVLGSTALLPPKNFQYSVETTLQWFFREPNASWELNCRDGVCSMEAQLVGTTADDSPVSVPTRTSMGVNTRLVNGLGITNANNAKSLGSLWVDGLRTNVVVSEQGRTQLQAACLDKGEQLLGGGSASFDLVFDLQNKFNTLDLPKGRIKGTLKSAAEISTADGIDVQNATVKLFKQDSFVREKLSNETNTDFDVFLIEQGRKQIGESKDVKPDDKGRVTYKDIPLLESFSVGGTTAFRPAYYTIEVTNGKSEACTDCVTLSDGTVDVNETETVRFSNNLRINTRPDTTAPVEHEIPLTPLDGIDKKMGLVTALGASTISPNNYKPIEDDVAKFLKEITDGNRDITPELSEGIQRAILAETVVLDGARFSSSLLKLMLKGLGTVLADVFDDVVNFRKDGKTSLEKDMKFTEKKITEIKADKWKIGDRAKALKEFEGTKKRLAEFKGLADKLDAMSKSLKVLGAGVAEFSGNKDKEFVGLVNKGINIFFRTVKSFVLSQGSRTGAARGGAQGLAKIAIEEGIGASFPFVFDDRVLPSYARDTAPFLRESVNEFIKPWDKANPENFSADNIRVGEIRSNLNKTANEAIIDTVALQDSAGVLDLTQDVAEVVGAVFKPAEVIAKIVQTTKYINNVRSVRKPYTVVFRDIEGFVQDGTSKAFGKDVSSSVAGLSDLDQPSDQRAFTQSPVAARRVTARFFSPMPGSSSALIETLNRLSTHLTENDIGTALALSGGDAADGYLNQAQEWERTNLLFLLQASGLAVSATSADVGLTDILTEDVELKLVQVDLEQKVADLYFHILTLVYEDPEDPLYIADRNNVLSLIELLISTLDTFDQSLNSLDTRMGGMELLPAIYVQTSGFVSQETAGDTITLSPEEFTLSAHIRNISDVPVSNLSGELTLTSSEDSVAIAPTVDVPVEIGTLEGDDGVDGSGADETDIAWTITYNGDLGSESIFTSVNILENGDDPSAFVTNEAQDALIIDPSIADNDLDFMPDDWEGANGLDLTKDDAQKDSDNDGLTNVREFELGTAPQQADTDGDGLSDGEETTGGADGFVTDPLTTDTDDDGVPDGSDGQPVDGGTSDVPTLEERIGEPEISVDRTAVAITRDERLATVRVTNRGTGTLNWVAVSENEAIATVTPSAPDLHNGDGLLLIVPPANFDFDTSGTVETTIRIIDLTGATHDIQSIAVSVGNAGADALARVFVTVEDEQGAPISQAKIRVKHQVTKEKIKGVTDENGIYMSPFIEPADYKVICKKADFEKVKEAISLSGGDERSVNCRLQPLAAVE